jgi:phosphate/sulfate permease
MIIAGIITLIGLGIFLYSLKKIFWSKGKERKLVVWIIVAILGCALTFPAYIITTLYFHTNPHRWHEIILPLDGRVEGDIETVEFLLPKGKYIVLLSFENEDNEDTEMTINYKITLEDGTVVVEDKIGLKSENISYHAKSFVFDKDKTRGEFTATIIKPSPIDTKVKVGLSTHIFL